MSSSCSCHECVEACSRAPGWMLPDEAQRAIDAGHAKKLMLDWHEEDGERNRYVLCPAVNGNGGKRGPNRAECRRSPFAFLSLFDGGLKRGRCIYLTKNDECAIHSSGFKPYECREVLVCKDMRPTLSYLEIAKKWQTSEGRKLIRRWKKLVGFNERTLRECH